MDDSIFVHYFLLAQVKLMFLLMVVSLLGTIYDYSRMVWAEKHRVRVKISGVVPSEDEMNQGESLVLSAANSSRREVTLLGAGLRLADGSELEFVQPDFSFPRTLDALGRCTIAIDSSYLLLAIQHRGCMHKPRFVGYVKDEKEHVYESKPFILTPRVLAFAG
jgi:hypothetical protein